MAKTSALFDDFDDNSIASKWSRAQEGGATTSETSQHIKMSLPASSTATDYTELASTATRDFSSSYIFLQVLEVPNAATHSDASLEIDLNGGGTNFVRWIYEFGTIFAQETHGGVTTTLWSTAFNISLYPWWRLREASGVVYWDTSTDGINWTNRASFTHGTTVTTAELWANLFSYQNETNPGNFIYDNFNLVPHTVSEQILMDGDADWTTATPKQHHQGDIGSIAGDASMNAFTRTTSAAAQRELTKRYIYKSFDKDGNYIGIWPDVTTDFGYAQDINTAGSAVQVTLARSIDTPQPAVETLETETPEDILTEASETLQVDYKSPNRVGAGTDVAVGNIVEVWVFYGSQDQWYDDTGIDMITDTGEAIEFHIGAPNGSRIFKGIIQEYEADYGTSDNVQVTIASFGVQMDKYVLKDGETTTVNYYSVDPGAMVRDALNNFISQGGGVTYDATSVRDAGTVITQKFQLNTFLEVMKQAVTDAPSNWFWFLDMGENVINFLPKPTEVSHRLHLGLHISKAKFKESITNLINLVYFTGGTIDNPFINDSLNDVAATVLTSHVGEAGATWTRHPQSAATGDLVFDNTNDAIYTNSANELMFMASGVSESDDMQVQMDVTQVSSTAVEVDIMARLDPSANTFYIVKYVNNSSNIDLYKRVAGTFTLLGTYSSFTPTTGTSFKLGIKCVGSSISAMVNGQVVLTVTDSAIPTGKRAGIRTNSVADTATTGAHMNNFEAIDLDDPTVSLFKKYSDSTSIATYGQGLERITDQRYTDPDSMQIVAQADIDQYKNSIYAGTVEVVARAYDIESIRLGQLVGFANFGNFIDNLELMVAGITYTPDTVQLKLEVLPPDVPKRVEDIKRNLQVQVQLNTPDTPD